MNNLMTNFKEELRKILIEFYIKAYHDKIEIGFFGKGCKHCKERVDETIPAITELVKGIVLEEIPIPTEPLSPFQAGQLGGFNSCRSEMLKRLEE